MERADDYNNDNNDDHYDNYDPHDGVVTTGIDTGEVLPRRGGVHGLAQMGRGAGPYHPQ
jgi:hypothetical protein